MTIETLLGMGVGGMLVLVGMVVGRFSHVKTHHRGKSERPPTAICSCDHGLGQHDEKGCNGEILRKDMRDRHGVYLGNQWVKCTCRKYDGPTPIEQYFATQTLPPKDA